MNNKFLKTLEFEKILKMLSDHALSENAKQKITTLVPYLKESTVKQKIKETTEAKAIIENTTTPPLASMKEINKIMILMGIDAMLIPEQLTDMAQFLSTCKRMKTYLKKAEYLNVEVAFYGGSITDITELHEEIDRSIRNGRVADSASNTLRDIRRKTENCEFQIKAKLDTLLKSNKAWLADGYVAIRNEHYTLPVKKEYKNTVHGTVIDTSQSGATLFIEPSSVRKLQDELSLLHIEEENEVRKILYTLTALVEEYTPQININIEAMETLDFIFAKAKLSIEMKAIPVPVAMQRKITIKSGRHPLLKTELTIPLDFEIGGNTSCIIITGPNTGGKTVALKTVGLLSLMAQSGLHIPACEGSELTMHNKVLCDIGDGQSITENLSTFSSHMTNIIEILSVADNESLVLLDELGSGTDPAEGMGLAVAILEELHKKNCLLVGTTHYPEIKDFAKLTPGFMNARMAFDKQSLQPLYKLEIGEAGESCALYIAKSLGLPSCMLERAYNVAYGQKTLDSKDMTTYDSDNFKNDASILENTVPPSPLRIEKEEIQKSPVPSRSNKFNIGDSVIVYPQKTTGIVYQKSNENGDIGVFIKDKKLLINHKRIKLQVSSSELYPDDYDFSIIFDTVENRKARHDMARKHDANVIIKYDI